MPSRITLYHTSHCPNCHAQEKILQQLQSQLPDLEIQKINLEQSPDVEIIPAIQSVPTILVNDYRFDGLLSAKEIKDWLGPDSHDKAYLNELLKSGHLDMANIWLQHHPDALIGITELLADDTIELTVRVGLDALFEQLAASMDLSSLVEPLGHLLDTVPDTLCIDILYYLSMIDSPEAHQFIKKATARQHPEVQRIARELLAEIEEHS